MTFNFDGGDILVILLVAIVLIIFRRLDRTGRSLEKVRRYAEKSKGELDAIVVDRELVLKDLAVDLEVQEQTNREILARAEAAREEIISRTSELEERVERIEAHERALEELNDLAMRVDENLSRLKDESAYVDDVGLRLNDARDKFSRIEEKDAARFDALRTEMADRFEADLQNTRAGIDEADRQLSLFRETLEGLNTRRDAAVGEKLGEFRDDLERAEADFRERLDKVSEEGARLEDDAFTALNEKIDSRTERLESNWIGGMNELKEQVSSTAGDIQEVLADTRRDMETITGEYKVVEESLKEAAASFDERVEGLRTKVDQYVDRKETDLLETAEGRQSDHRKAIDERFERLEGFIGDMDTLAESLRASQKQTLAEVENTFTAFDARMSERREEEKAKADEDAAHLRQDMAEMERGLDDLKSRAYENVSEKLQVFEDDFFADLKSRDEQMNSALDEWRRNTEIEIAELGLKAGRDREETERRHSAELKQKLAELQTRVVGQFETVQEQVDSFRESASGRISSAEREIADFKKTLSERVAKEREASFAEIRKSLAGFDRETEEKIAGTEKSVSQKVTDYAAEIDGKIKGLADEVDAARGQVSDWKVQLAVQISEAEQNSAERISAMTSNFSEAAAELQDEYSRKTDQLVLESGEERGTLRRDIADIEEAVARLSAELTEKSRDTLDALKEQSENFLLEFRKNSREARDEVERKIKDLRQSVQESRERADASRREMAALSETEYNRLTRNLTEIDKRQKAFIAETRVFERADQMKESLEADIRDLSRQLELVGAGREEIQAINDKYDKAVNLYEDVQDKIARFLSEQQKVDSLEGKIVRIGNLSEAVDLRLDRVSEANDTLQNLQVRLKQLEDLHEDLGGRYKRLSDKSAVLDAATEGVDKNFDRVSALESSVKQLIDRLIPVREELKAAEERQATLDGEREKIDAVIEKVSSLDDTIGELDRRFEELSRAREWLARTETRLEEINAETQQQVKLLGTLSRRDSRKGPGSPDMSTREMVVRLARQGWNSDEIARNTKLSRGEVELILELTPSE